MLVEHRGVFALQSPRLRFAAAVAADITSAPVSANKLINFGYVIFGLSPNLCICNGNWYVNRCTTQRSPLDSIG